MFKLKENINKLQSENDHLKKELKNNEVCVYSIINVMFNIIKLIGTT